MDDLIERLRARAADPERRTTVRPSALWSEVRTLDLGGLVAMGRSVSQSLRQVVDANREGRVDREGHQTALELERQMQTPVATVLPAPALEAAIAAAESRLTVRLPLPLRCVYAEIADGGFGPGEGILPLEQVVRRYEELRSPGQMPRGRTWPLGLLPIVSRDPGWDCVEAAGGRVVSWDPEELSERSSEARFQASFEELFPTVEAWLEDWLGSPTQEEQMAAERARMQADFMSRQVEMAREARARFGRMTPVERAAMGLPEVGWERVVWGGLGFDEDEPGV